MSVFDPYIDWALYGPGRLGLLPRDGAEYLVPLMVRPKASAAVFLAELRRLPRAEQRRWQVLSRALETVAPGPGDNFLTFFLPPTAAEALLSPRNQASPRIPDSLDLELLSNSVTFGPPLPSDRVRPDGKPPASPARRPDGETCPPTVIVGIIDDGIAFAHERFRSAAATTRFEALWLQDGVCAPGSSVGYGRDIRADTINTWLDKSVGDEDVFYGPGKADVLDYRLPGHKPLAQRIAHGTHVLDRAFGFDLCKGQDWRIIGVQLPVATVADSSGALLAPYAVDAVKYIERTAREAYPDIPIVIAFSYGFTAGPHDGTHPIERGIHDVVSTHNALYPHAKMRIVIPSGNSHLARLHARVTFREPTEDDLNPPLTAALFWRVQPEDTTPSFVEIWLPGPYDPGKRIALGLTSPDGEASDVMLAEGDQCTLTMRRDGAIVCQAFFRADPFSGRAMFLIAVQPTARHDADGPVAPAGVWTIRLVNRGFERDAVIKAWIQRDEAPFGYPPRGRQSYFDHADYRRFDPTGHEEQDDEGGSLVQRGGSTNALATGTTPIVVGGLLRKELRPAKYSAGGPNAWSPQPGPSALVTSDDSAVHGGVLAAGTRSGSCVALNGTSVAGPGIARWMALRLQDGLPANRNAVELFAATEELALPQPRPAPARGGSGRIRFPPSGSHPRDCRFDDE